MKADRPQAYHCAIGATTFTHVADVRFHSSQKEQNIVTDAMYGLKIVTISIVTAPHIWPN